jgi:hypothetical protein
MNTVKQPSKLKRFGRNLLVKSLKLFAWAVTFVYKAISFIFVIALFKFPRFLILFPINCIRRTICKNNNPTGTAQLILKSIGKTSQFVYKIVCQVAWWIMHQLALTDLDKIRQEVKKPVVSIGWELWSEFNPRYRLDYWMAESHITVEVRRWSYNQKQNKLRYIEYATKRHAHVHSPSGIPHMSSKIHWWEPVVPSTTKPYAPLHSTSKVSD